jgi:hypothetical protein
VKWQPLMFLAFYFIRNVAHFSPPLWTSRLSVCLSHFVTSALRLTTGPVAVATPVSPAAVLFLLPLSCFSCRSPVSPAAPLFLLPLSCFTCRCPVSPAAVLFHLLLSCFTCCPVSPAAVLFLLPLSCFSCCCPVSPATVSLAPAAGHRS